MSNMKKSSLRVEAVKRDFLAEGRQRAEGSLCRPEVTKSVYGQDAYTAFLHVAHKHARSNSTKQCAVQKSTCIDAQSRKVGAGRYPTKLLFLRVLGALKCAVCEQQ